ncbi:hypothetical protein [Nonomuraea endophytica]|uniref:Uncharacterized protein n=1 Tax=Nonomuraea endophytica TaxID=714136 RepID=A0A7W8A8D4_9ACTN|nr:hypothetical protein [Nonomuraea endophytica]MBB5081511.1 hypothetical protein [Nonomuraea endophytica]
MLTAIERDCGWVTPKEYGEFCDAYGYDVTSSPAYPVLRRTRLLRMTTWLAQKYGESPEISREVQHRIRSLENDEQILSWSAY